MQINKTIGIAIMLMMLIVNVVAEEEVYQVNTPINLRFTCTINEAIPSASATYNITISNPQGVATIENVETTPLGQGAFNYTVIFGDTGRYKIEQFCYDGTDSYSNTEYVTIVALGNSKESNFTEKAFFIGLAMLISIFIFIKISKFFGSLMIMLIGMGILFTAPQNGWIGWIIIASGFIAVLYSIMSKPKKYRR